MSKLLLAMKVFTNGILIKSWAAISFKFQWQNLMLDDRFGPELTSVSPDDKSKRYLKFFIIDMIVNM